MSQAINDIQDEIIDEFALFDDWMGRYEYIIDLGKELPLIEDQYKVDENLVKGCQSQVWLHADMKDDLLHFTADSDAVITKGIISLLIRVLNDHSPEEIAYADLYFIDEIGLREHLSPTRSNGLSSMVKQLKAYALAYQAKNN